MNRSSADRVGVGVDVDVDEEHYYKDVTWLYRLLSIHRTSAQSGKKNKEILIWYDAYKNVDNDSKIDDN